ncbi:MAG: response regulator [Chloroflexota bacterium]
MSERAQKIAVVDDDFTTRTLIVDFLEDRDFSVVHASDPNDISDQAKECQAFIMDVMIGKNRYAGINYIIEQRRNNVISPDALVIFISNFGRENEEITSLLRQVGKYEWLDKPIQFAKLGRLVAEV